MRIRRPWTTLVFTTSVFLQPQFALAQAEPTTACTAPRAKTPFIVFDMTTTAKTSQTTRVFTFASDPKSKPLELLKQGPRKALEALKQTRAASAGTSDRFITKRGDEIPAYCIHDAETDCRIDFNEEKRTPQLATDLKTLAKVASLIFLPKPATEATSISWNCESYILSERYAYLTVTATVSPTPTPPAPKTVSTPGLPSAAIPTSESVTASPEPRAQTLMPTDPDSLHPTHTSNAAPGTQSHASNNLSTTKADSPKTDNGSASAKVATGAIEHWFLSADLPLTDTKQLKLSDDQKSLVPSKTPSSFMIGVDFKFGDLLTDETAFTRNLVAKLLLKASRKPAEEYGAALALRGHYLDALGLDLSLFSPFVGITGVLNDAIRNGQPERNSRRTFKWVAGISFNLDKAVTWLTPEKKSGTNAKDEPKQTQSKASSGH